MIFDRQLMRYTESKKRLKKQKICSYTNAQHFYKILVILKYLRDNSNCSVNKRAVYYSLLENFKDQADLDDRIFEVCQILGNIPRNKLGIQASSKGMLAGSIMNSIELEHFVDHIPIPGD